MTPDLINDRAKIETIPAKLTYPIGGTNRLKKPTYGSQILYRISPSFDWYAPGNQDIKKYTIRIIW